MRDKAIISHSENLITQPRRTKLINFMPGLTVGGALASEIAGFRDRREAFVITINGALVDDLRHPIRNGDIVTLTGEITPPLIAGAAYWGAFAAAAMGVSANVAMAVGGFAAMLTAVVIGGVVSLGMGLLMNTLFPVNTPPPALGNSDPTYGWNGFQNPRAAGGPIPVAIGNVAAPPPIIGHYFKPDDDYNEWAYFLLAGTLGDTDDAITASDILVGDERLTSYSDYTFGTTRGNLTINSADTTALAPFEDIHHYREFDKELKSTERYAPSTTVLGNFNAADGTTDFQDDSGRGGTWTAHGSAEISNHTVKFGACALDLPSTGDYYSTDDFETLRLPADFTIETWITGPLSATNTTHGILFQKQVVRDTNGRKSFRYMEFTIEDSPVPNYSRIYFRVNIGVPYVDPVSGTVSATKKEWTRTLNLFDDYLFSEGTWYHLCVQSRSGRYALYVNGTKLAEAEGSMGETWDVRNDVIDWQYEYEPLLYANLETEHKNAFTTYIGRVQKIDWEQVRWPEDADEPDETNEVTLYGNCVLDDLRVVRDVAYAWDGFTAPSAELDVLDDEDPTFSVITESNCDRCNLIVEFPYGLYTANNQGDRETINVEFNFRYREVGDTPWTDSVWEFAGKRNTPLRVDHEITFPSRGQYEIQPLRLTPPHRKGGKKISDSFLTGVDEIIEEELHYPGVQCQVVAIKASDRLSGQVKPIRVIHNRSTPPSGTVCDDITGYNDLTNPAWAASHMMLDRYEGRFMPRARSHVAYPTEWLAWATYCDETVAGNKRCTCNAYLADPGNLQDALGHIEMGGRAKIVQIGLDYKPIIDKPWSGAPKYLFNVGNILPGSWGWEAVPKVDKSDAVEVKFLDKDRGWKMNSKIHKASWFDSLEAQPKIFQVEARTINNLDEATRLAILLMQKTEYITRTCWWSCDIESALVSPGDVVMVHPPRGTYAGRLPGDVSASVNVTLDRSVTMPTATYDGHAVFTYRDRDGTVAQVDIAGPWDTETNEIELDSAVTLYAYDVWSISLDTQAGLLWRVQSQTHLDGDHSQDVKYTATLYVPEMYYHDDYGSGLVAI